MTNALTATKTPKLSSQGVPDVILVLNKEEIKETNRTTKKRNTNKNKKKEAHAQAKAHAHAHAQAQAKAHTQAKRHMQLREVYSISLSKNGIQKKNNNINSRKTNAACCQSSIVSPGSSKTIPNILKVSSRVPQIQKNSHRPVRNAN